MFYFKQFMNILRNNISLISFTVCASRIAKIHNRV